MKKQILFVFTATLSLALASCQSNPEKVENQIKTTESNDQLSQQFVESREESSRTFEELKREADEATLKAKEEIKYRDADKTGNPFVDLKKEAEVANRKAIE